MVSDGFPGKEFSLIISTELSTDIMALQALDSMNAAAAFFTALLRIHCLLLIAVWTQQFLADTLVKHLQNNMDTNAGNNYIALFLFLQASFHQNALMLQDALGNHAMLHRM